MVHTSPHLIGYIRRFEISPSLLSTENLSVISNLSFTNLTRFAIRIVPHLSLPSTIAIQQLLSLPTLRYVWILCSFSEPSIFLRTWERCSPSITHLVLHCLQRFDKTFPPIHQHHSPPLKLQSLRVAFLGRLGGWFTHPSSFRSLGGQGSINP